MNKASYASWELGRTLWHTGKIVSNHFHFLMNRFKIEMLAKDRMFASYIPNILEFIFNHGNRHSGEISW